MTKIDILRRISPFYIAHTKYTLIVKHRTSALYHVVNQDVNSVGLQ